MGIFEDFYVNQNVRTSEMVKYTSMNDNFPATQVLYITELDTVTLSLTFQPHGYWNQRPTLLCPHCP